MLSDYKVWKDAVFDEYRNLYEHILERIYPAKNSTGFPERNLSVNFSKAYERIANANNEDAYSWFEFQFGERNNLHVDAIILNDTTHELIIVESKRYSNTEKKIREVGEDIDRIYEFSEEIRKEDRIPLYENEHIYGVILADLWKETNTKEQVLQAYDEKNFLKKYSEKLRNIHQPENEQYFTFLINGSRMRKAKPYYLLSILWQIK